MESQQVTKGRIVMYTHNIDTDPNESPNISAAIVTHIFERNGSADPQKIALRVFHGTGDFIANAEFSCHPSERGKWHWPRH